MNGFAVAANASFPLVLLSHALSLSPLLVPHLAKRLLKGFTRETTALAVGDVDVKTVTIGLLKSKSDRTRLETLAFLRDTLHGRPAQSVSLSGGVNVNMAVWRPLESLTDEEIQLLDSITKKMSGQANVNALPDARQNQTESKPAIEAGSGGV
jgi:hypothetical protein